MTLHLRRLRVLSFALAALGALPGLSSAQCFGSDGLSSRSSGSDRSPARRLPRVRSRRNGSASRRACSRSSRPRRCRRSAGPRPSRRCSPPSRRSGCGPRARWCSHRTPRPHMERRGSPRSRECEGQRATHGESSKGCAGPLDSLAPRLDPPGDRRLGGEPRPRGAPLVQGVHEEPTRDAQRWQCNQRNPDRRRRTVAVLHEGPAIGPARERLQGLSRGRRRGSSEARRTGSGPQLDGGARSSPGRGARGPR